MENLLVELLNATLCKRPLNVKIFEGATGDDWQKCLDLALKQNVLAMTFPAMSSLPKELRTSFTLWSKWMAYTQSVAEQSQYKQQVVKKIGSWLTEDGLTTTLIKGFSLSILYPKPELREFGDIDIFSGGNYEAVNACFAKHGIKVDSVDGHRAYFKVDSISVEHHFAFSNTKVKNGLNGPEEALQRLAVTDPQPTSMSGINFPNPAFTALFVGWHAYEHFLQEKIEMRYIIDWVLSLKKLNEDEARIVNSMKTSTRWGSCCDTLTAIASHQVGLPKDWFPAREIEAANSIVENKTQIVWNDIINAPRTANSMSMNLRRVYIVKRMLRNSWKFKEYADMAAHKFVFKEFIGHVSKKKVFNL